MCIRDSTTSMISRDSVTLILSCMMMMMMMMISCRAVIENWMFPSCCIHRSRDSICFSTDRTTPELPFHRGSGRHIIYGSLYPKVSPKRHLDHFCRFCTSRPFDQHTDRQIHRPRYVRHLKHTTSALSMMFGMTSLVRACLTFLIFIFAVLLLR